FRTAPLGLVPKPNSNKFRLIQDLSFPRNNPSISSVNSHVCSDDFPTAWGTFDDASRMVLEAPPGSTAAAFDISAAYRITPVLPDQQHVLCISWKGTVYVDRAVMFGLASSAGVFGAVADMLVAIYRAHGISHVIKWVDDFFVIRLPHQTFSEAEFIAITAQLGVPWCLEKTRLFASAQRYIGFIWDLSRKTVAIPPEKIAAMLILLAYWLAPGFRTRASEAASLHGKLVHLATIFRLLRPFLHALSLFSASFCSPRARLHPPSDVKADIKWISWLLPHMPNELPLSLTMPLDLGWWGDAS
ncbi:hypothetical protein LXA43DRAFT_840224, partial [Ganoderma leucocontextum]